MGTCLNRLIEAVLTSTHKLCFGAKIRKIDIPLHTPFLIYKSGVQGAVYFLCICFHSVVFSGIMTILSREIYN